MGAALSLQFNNASLMAIDQLHLPVANILSGLSKRPVLLLRIASASGVRDPAHPGLWGMPREPIVMFEGGPAFEQKSGFRGAVLANLPQRPRPAGERLPASPRTQFREKAPRSKSFTADGRVYLLGFKPQWRGQSHGTYKLVFNAIYDSPSMARPSAFRSPAERANPRMENWSGVASKVHADLPALLLRNRAFFCRPRPRRRGRAE